MSDTLRTDAQAFIATPESEDLAETMDVVTLEFARELERELNASKQAPTDNDTWNSLLESRARLERELRESRAREAQLRAALEYIRDVLQTEINMGNYGDDDVRRINDESIDASRKAAEALSTFAAKHKL